MTEHEPWDMKDEERETSGKDGRMNRERGCDEGLGGMNQFECLYCKHV